MIEAINADRLPRFANGGAIGEAGGATFGGSQTIVAPQIAVNVQGSPGMTSADHERMGETIGRAAMDSLKQMLAKEIRTQMRPGGLLR